MAANGIPSIVRRKFANQVRINPWILSRNSGQMVNSCVRNVYKEMPQQFNRELLKINNRGPENMAPIRRLKTWEKMEQPKPLIKSMTTRRTAHLTGQRLLEAVMLQSRKGAVNELKRGAPPPNFNVKRYTSGSNASKNSVYRRFDERRWNRDIQTPPPLPPNPHPHPHPHPHPQPQPHSHPPPNPLPGPLAGCKKYFNVTKLDYGDTGPNRRMTQQIGSMALAQQIGNLIRKDLMPVKRGNRTFLNAKTIRRDPKKRNLFDVRSDDPFDRWNHPPPLEQFQPRIPEIGKRGQYDADESFHTYQLPKFNQTAFENRFPMSNGRRRYSVRR